MQTGNIRHSQRTILKLTLRLQLLLAEILNRVGRPPLGHNLNGGNLLMQFLLVLSNQRQHVPEIAIQRLLKQLVQYFHMPSVKLHRHLVHKLSHPFNRLLLIAEPLFIYVV